MRREGSLLLVVGTLGWSACASTKFNANREGQWCDETVPLVQQPDRSEAATACVWPDTHRRGIRDRGAARRWYELACEGHDAAGCQNLARIKAEDARIERDLADFSQKKLEEANAQYDTEQQRIAEERARTEAARQAAQRERLDALRARQQAEQERIAHEGAVLRRPESRAWRDQVAALIAPHRLRIEVNMRHGTEEEQAVFLRAMGWGKPGSTVGYYEAKKALEAGPTVENIVKIVREVRAEFGNGKEGRIVLAELLGVPLTVAEGSVRRTV